MAQTGRKDRAAGDEEVSHAVDARIGVDHPPGRVVVEAGRRHRMVERAEGGARGIGEIEPRFEPSWERLPQRIDDGPACTPDAVDVVVAEPPGSRGQPGAEAIAAG